MSAVKGPPAPADPPGPGTGLHAHPSDGRATLSDIQAYGILVGTFLPLLWGVGMALAVPRLSPTLHWPFLLLAPIPGAGLCWLVASPVMKDGNLLATVVYVLGFLALLVYYPALLATWIWRRVTG